MKDLSVLLNLYVTFEKTRFEDRKMILKLIYYRYAQAIHKDIKIIWNWSKYKLLMIITKIQMLLVYSKCIKTWTNP